MSDPYSEYLEAPDRRHYTRFVTAYLSSVERLAQRIVVSPDLADDVVQETFLRLAEFNPSQNVENPRAYVLRTALNIARDHLRRERTRGGHEEAAGILKTPARPSALEEALSRESVREIYDGIARLPEEYRVALHLLVVEDLSYREIAEVMGVSIDTTSSRIHRARAKLKHLLGSTLFAVGWAHLDVARAKDWFPGSIHSPERYQDVLNALDGIGAPTLAGQSGARLSSLAACGAILVGVSVFPAFTVTTPDAQITLGRERSMDRTVEINEKGLTNMNRWQRFSAPLVVSLGVTTLAQTAQGEAGDLILMLTSALEGVNDITLDSKRETFWVSSFSRPELVEYDKNLKRVLRTIPVPFENPGLSNVAGIAYNPTDDTLFIVDGLARRVVESDVNGTPTGRVIDVPPAKTEDYRRLSGIAFDTGGDDGRGSIYLFHAEVALIREMTLDGGVIRSFPNPADPDRFGGRPDITLSDVEPVYDDGDLVGFDAVIDVGAGDYHLLPLDTDGNADKGTVSLVQAGGEVGGFLRSPFPDPTTGEPVDAYICAVVHGSRFAILRGSEAAFHEIRNASCETTDRMATVRWNRGQVYDEIAIVVEGEVAETLPGDADGWEGQFEVDGVYELTVRARDGDRLSLTTPCVIVIGAGQVLNSVDFEVRQPADSDIAIDEDGTLIVTARSERTLNFFDQDLNLLRTAPISEFFLGNEDRVVGVARGAESETVFLYNSTQHTIGTLTYTGELLFAVDANLPDLEEAPAQPRYLGRPAGMTFDPLGDGGAGSLWLVERARHVLYELGQSGNVLRELPHPYVGLEPTPPLGCESTNAFRGGRLGIECFGITMVKEGLREVYLSGGLFREENLPWIFRMSLETGEIVPGSTVPLRGLQNFASGLQTIAVDGESQLIAVSGRRVASLSLRPPEVPAPTFLFGRQPSGMRRVELEFTNNGPYDFIEVRRDRELLKMIDGAATNFVDETPPPGFRKYTVRGVRENRPSDASQFSVQVGVGAVLEQKMACPLPIPGYITHSPLDGSFFVARRNRGQTVYRYAANLELLEEREVGWSILGLALRVTPDGEPLLYHVKDVAGSRIVLVTETVDGAVLSEAEIDSPRADGRITLLGQLVWASGSDTFYYQELISNTFVEMSLEGETLRTFPHPLPPIDSTVIDSALAFSAERGTLFFAGAEGTERWVTRFYEMQLDGTLTDYTVPVPFGPTISDQIFGAVLAGRELVATGTLGKFGAILRINAFEDVSSVQPFIRGNSNGDENVDLADAIYLLNYLFAGGRGLDCRDAADINDDGSVNLSDPVALLNYLFSAGDPPPPPFPEAGLDPTRDVLTCGER